MRTVLPVTGGRAVDDAGVAGRHRRVADAEPVDHAGAEALDHDVGRSGQRQERLPSVVILEVDQDPAHAAVAAVGEELRLALARHRPRAPGPTLTTLAP